MLLVILGKIVLDLRVVVSIIVAMGTMIVMVVRTMIVLMACVDRTMAVLSTISTIVEIVSRVDLLAYVMEEHSPDSSMIQVHIRGRGTV